MAPESILRDSGIAGVVGCLDSCGVHSEFLCDTVFDLPCIDRPAGIFCVTGVDTVRFWFPAGTKAVVAIGGARLGGLGGGIFSKGVVGVSRMVLCGLVGKTGLVSPVMSGVSWPLKDPFVSNSRSLILLAVAGCIGGGSNPTCRVLAFGIVSLGGAAGRLGSIGGDSSPSLLGGLLNGDILSAMFALDISTGPSAIHDLLEPTGGLSKLARGVTSPSRCRRNSADLRGGGGEGGLKVGFVLGERASVLEGRLGILNLLPVGMGERAAGFTTSSGFNRLGSSLEARLRDLPLGGDCGGSTVRAGAGTTRGVSCGGGNALRAGERASPFSLMARGARPGFDLGSGGGSFTRQEVDSRGLSARGPGDTFRLVVCGGCGGGCWWPMFSKCDRREETGFCLRRQFTLLSGRRRGNFSLDTHDRRAIRPSIIWRCCHGCVPCSRAKSEKLRNWVKFAGVVVVVGVGRQ